MHAYYSLPLSRRIFVSITLQVMRSPDSPDACGAWGAWRAKKELTFEPAHAALAGRGSATSRATTVVAQYVYGQIS
jgi:hypothetical protein